MKNTSHSLYPDNDLQTKSLPFADHSRLHKPTRVDTLSCLTAIIEELKLTQTEMGPWEGFYISMITTSRFPYANGRGEVPYFYSVIQQDQTSVECMDLSTIIQFRTQDHIKIFWLIPVSDGEGSKQWFHLYSNSVWRDATVSREFIKHLNVIAKSLARERRRMVAV